MSDRDEWRSAVQSMNEVDRDLAYQEPRRAIGVCGDRSDAIGDGRTGDDGDEE